MVISYVISSLVVVNDNFALVADWTNQEIFQIDLDTQEVHAVSGKGDIGFTGVHYDDVREKVIAGQLYESEMVSFNLNGSNRQVFADSGNIRAVNGYLNWYSNIRNPL